LEKTVGRNAAGRHRSTPSVDASVAHRVSLRSAPNQGSLWLDRPIYSPIARGSRRGRSSHRRPRPGPPFESRQRRPSAGPRSSGAGRGRRAGGATTSVRSAAVLELRDVGLDRVVLASQVVEALALLFDHLGRRPRDEVLIGEFLLLAGDLFDQLREQFLE